MAKKKQSESVPTSSDRVLRQRKSTTGGEKVDGKDKGKMPVEVKEKAKGNKSGANEAGNGENAAKEKLQHGGNAEVSGSSLKNCVMIQPKVFVSLLAAFTAVTAVIAVTAVASPTITTHTAPTSSALTSTLTSALTSTAAFASQTINSLTASTSFSPSTRSYQFPTSVATPFPDSSPTMLGALILTAYLRHINQPRIPVPLPIPRGPATVRFPKNKKPFPKLQMTKK